MYLKSFYSEPDGLFPTIEFKNGINFIFAKKEKSSDSKKSLNGVGKTLLLHLIDYALLSQETEVIKRAKKFNNLSKQSVVLEFIIDGDEYMIKRPFEESKKNIEFGKKGSSSLYTIKELSGVLCDLIFKNEPYKGKYANFWLRKLIPFFVKKQSTKIENFLDPIKYIKDPPVMELVQYHLFFMGLDNTTLSKNFSLQLELKKKDPVIKEVKNFIQDTYKLEDISQAENEADKLKTQIVKLEANIKNFKLAEQYEDVETKSNQLTGVIKSLWFQNFSDKKKIESYRDSFQIKDELNIIKVKKIYSELSDLLGKNISKTLEEAVEFRRNVAKSREEFLSEEIGSLESSIKDRDDQIKKLEQERSALFKFLEAKNAITDLSEAYFELSKKREELNNLSGKIKLYLDLKTERAELKKEEANIFSEIVDFSNKIKNELTEFRKIFFEIHDAIYVESKERSKFTLEPNDNKDSKIDIDVSLPADLSKGKNQGRTLIYDLSVLFHGIERGIRLPRFLIHDGIFDGMDKAHFVSLYEYLERLADEGKRFQYIITLNEEGTLNENFGNADKVNPKKIEEEAIITLTQTKTLFDNRWD